MTDLSIIHPRSNSDWDAVRALCRAYFDHLLEADPDAAPVMAEHYPEQAREDLLRDLPQVHRPPGGCCILLLDAQGTPLATGSYVPLTPKAVEVKRVYVAPAGQGQGLGRAIMTKLESEAIATGHTRMLLDTMHFLTPAISLYLSLGFRVRGGYHPAHETLGELVRCFEKDLT